MDFFAINGKRPTRLSEGTRRFAYESLNHKYGKLATATPWVNIDYSGDFESLSPLQKHDVAINSIATLSPIRICEGELISGAATLGDAIDHRIPARFNGNIIFASVSHLTVDFETVLKKGINHIYATANESLIKFKGTDKEPFILSCLSCLDSMKEWHGRYLSELESMEGYGKNYENLKRVPFFPASSFHEAVQSLWFTFAFIRLCGNWPGIGRIDHLLGDYLEKDLANGTLSLDEAREILAHFFIKGCEWIKGGDYGSGDAQHYQNILLGGIDEDGNDVTNTVTYIVLDILEELGISDFPTTVRINKNTDDRLLSRVADVIRLGGGVIAVYNEDLIIQSLIDYGYDLREARCFANDGCWEVQIPGKTYFMYQPFDSLYVLQSKTLKGYSSGLNYPDFECLYNTYINGLRLFTNKVISSVNYRFADRSKPVDEWTWKTSTPCTVVSLFEKGCIENGLSYNEGGPVYNVCSPHIGGLTDTVNSLYAIKKLVYDDKKISLGEFMTVLKNNWEGNEALRQYALNKYVYYGNDNDEVDEIAARIVKDFSDICDDKTVLSKYKTPAGISTFGRQLIWSSRRLATPFGKKAHDILSGNFSPTPGTDKEGAAAIIKSYCKSDLSRTVCGAALDIKLLPSAVNGKNGNEVLKSLIMGFVNLGGFFMQLDIADTEILKDAQKNPENYQNLSVRVSGWNARFVTLDKEWQDMIIAQMGSDI